MNATIQKLFDLSGRVALVTGASGHLGFSMAEALAEAGCRVIVSSRDIERSTKIISRLGGPEKGKHSAVAFDHLDEKSITQGFNKASAIADRLDILVNNAHEPLGLDWTTVTGEQFTRQLANATGYFLLARLFRDHAVERKAPGSIINLGSMYASVASYPDVYAEIGPANPAAYQTLKASVVQLTRHLAIYWAKDGIRVNCISPGPFPNPKAPAELVKRIEARSPLGRIGQPHELKGAIVFLASDASSYVTGHELIVDGGWTAW